MEPLGVDLEVVELPALKRWADFPIQPRYDDYSNLLGDSAKYTVTPFSCQSSLNAKIAIW